MRTKEIIGLSDGYSIRVYDTGYKKLEAPDGTRTFIFADAKTCYDDFKRICDDFIAVRAMIRDAGMYNDSVTRDFVKANLRLLQQPEAMSPRELGDAVTYCKDIDNQFSREMMRRSGHLDAFALAPTAKERKAVLQKSAQTFGFWFG